MASCRTLAAEMLRSTASLAAGRRFGEGCVETSEASAGHLAETTASRPHTQIGMQACSAKEPSDTSPNSHS